jgi:hypothetical protein
MRSKSTTLAAYSLDFYNSHDYIDEKIQLLWIDKLYEGAFIPHNFRGYGAF